MMTNPNKPRISVIITTFNREGFISEAIGSVLNQSYTDWEMIIVDDASTDNTESVVKKYLEKDARIKYIKNPKNIGIAETRNIGIEMSRGSYIAPLDSDDVWLDKDKLKKQAEFLDKNLDYCLLGGGIINIDNQSRQIKKVLFPVYDSLIRNIILQYNPFCHSSVLYRKSIAIKLGGYSKEYSICTDYDFWLRMGTKQKFTNIPQVLAGYRVHGGNITHNKRLTTAKEILDIVRKNKRNYKRPLTGIAKAYLRIILAYFRS